MRSIWRSPRITSAISCSPHARALALPHITHSHHKCDFLLTWNCAHLANANKFGHIRRVNALLGLFVPELVTPLQLLGGEDAEESGPGHRRGASDPP